MDRERNVLEEEVRHQGFGRAVRIVGHLRDRFEPIQSSRYFVGFRADKSESGVWGWGVGVGVWS